MNDLKQKKINNNNNNIIFKRNSDFSLNSSSYNKNESMQYECHQKKNLNNILSFRGFSQKKAKNKNYNKIALSKLKSDNKFRFFLPRLIKENENDLSFLKISNLIKFKKRLNICKNEKKELSKKQKSNLSNNLFLSKKSIFEQTNRNLKVVKRNESTGILNSRIENYRDNSKNKDDNKSPSTIFLNILSKSKNKIFLSKRRFNRNSSTIYG